MGRLFAGLAILLLAVGCEASGERTYEEDDVIRVFAAASLTDVLEAMADSFATAAPGSPRVQLNVAGSSLLARQIEHGAEADLFVSAHPSWTTHLFEGGFLAAPSELGITNRLVLVARTDAARLEEVERLALADPAHVPAGIYARDALVCAQLWDRLEGRTAATVDVRAALVAVQEGAADAALVYSTDARFAPDLHVSEPFAMACGPDVKYTMSLSLTATPGAELFAGFLSDSLRAATWEAFGFARRIR